MLRAVRCGLAAFTLAALALPAALSGASAAGVPIPAPAAARPFEGSATIDEAADPAAGKPAFDVHAAANPTGESRGQVLRAP